MLQVYDPRNASILIHVGGELVSREDAGVSPFDSAVQGGDAVWEGLRLYDGRIFGLAQHLARLRSSARALAFAEIPSDRAIRRAIHETLEANGMDDGVHVRLTLTRGLKTTSGMDPRLNVSGPTLIVLAEWKAPVYDTSGLRLITSSVRRFPPDTLDPKIHHCNLIQSILAKIEANVAGADDALMLDRQGFIAETNATHLFFVENGVLRTPRLTACPEGVTRETVLELCAEDGVSTEIADLTLTEAYRSDEAFCSGTMGELASVIEIDGRAIGDGRPGAHTIALAERYRAHARATAESILDAGTDR